MATAEASRAAVPSSAASGAGLSLALLLVINLFNYIDRQVLAAVEPLMAKELFSPGDPDALAKMGLLPMAFLVSYMVIAPLFGWLGDRTKRWKLIGIGVALWSLASGATGLAIEGAGWLHAVGLGFVSGFGVMLVTRMFVGVGEGAYGPVAPALISDMYPVERRGSVLAMFYMAIPVGSALGYVIGGMLGSRIGWRAPFFAVVAPGLLLGLLCFLRPEPARGASDAVGAAGGVKKISLRDYGLLLRTPSYVLNVLGQTAMTFALGGVAFFMPRYVSEFRKAAELDRANLIFGVIVVVAGLLATLAGGWLGDRLRSRLPGAYLIVSGAAMGLGFPLFLAVLVTPFPACWVVIFLAVFCLFFNTGPSNTAIANVVPPTLRASAYALSIFIIHAFGDAISPTLIGKITGMANMNMNVGFLVVSFAFLAAAVFWFWGARYLARDEARVSAGGGSD